VTAWVDVKIELGTIPSPGSGRRFSTAVAKQVASAMASWKEHLPYLEANGKRPLVTKMFAGNPVLDRDTPPKIPRP
jgi:hypothetical protein